MNNNTKQKGFSLVELGVSLTIIAMVIAAVVAGSNLKDKFELNQAMEDIGNINSAVKEFKDILIVDIAITSSLCLKLSSNLNNISFIIDKI